MHPFDECCVLIPSSTLEDFPAHASDHDARSLLAGWTVLWHPRLLAAAKQLPAWYRADSPPDPPSDRIIVCPTASESMVPDGYRDRCVNREGCRWITGESRAAMLHLLQLDTVAGPVAPTRGATADADSSVEAAPNEVHGHATSRATRSDLLMGTGRSVGVEDFFALGYAFLQIQIMTRRLRYTSNLDELHLQSRAVAAAEAFLAGQADEAIDGLHDAFDALAQERDHYFASDPSLIDLTLLTPSVLDRFLASPARSPSATSPSPATEQTDANESSQTVGSSDAIQEGSAAREVSVLATPGNILIDNAVAGAIARLEPAKTAWLRQALRERTIGWAGGGPQPDVCLDTLTFNQAEAALGEAHRRTTEAIGVAPPVYARFSGGTPADMTAALVSFGYTGLVPIDFANGTGFGDESKVVYRAAGVEIEALTAKPIDASSDAAFLALASRLGEAIDSGEVATGLLAHWPGTACDTFADLRRVASWSLALGKFWNLRDYFTEGEHAYHHATPQAVSAGSAAQFASQVASGQVDPISTVTRRFRESVTAEALQRLTGMAALASGKTAAELGLRAQPDGESQSGGASQLSQSNGASQPSGTEQPAQGLVAALAKASGALPRPSQGQHAFLANPHGVGIRHTLLVAGKPPAAGEQVYAASGSAGQAALTVDAPGCGFAFASAADSATRPGLLKSLLRSRPKPIADAVGLSNEFMEVVMDPGSGGINGVYSGGTRGNRFSMRLTRATGRQTGLPGNRHSTGEPKMRCDRLAVTESSVASGTIESTGSLLDASGEAAANFTIRYTLKRGSRFLEVSGELQPTARFGDDPWADYIAARVAVASEAAIIKLLLRDKVHRTSRRRMVSPLGAVIDEAERQTLIASAGLAYHRRVGDRFLDTLLSVKGETCGAFQMHYGFDVPAPVASASAVIAPALELAVEPPAEIVNDAAPFAAPRGWVLHASPQSILVTSLDVQRRDDGKLAAIVRVVQTRGDFQPATLRFCRDVHFARLLDFAHDDCVNVSLNADDSKLDSEADRVRFSMAGHAVKDLLVVFA